MSISFQSMLNLSSNHVLRDTILTHIESQFLLHLTNVFFLFSGCSSIPIHPLGCLELEAFFLFFPFRQQKKLEPMNYSESIIWFCSEKRRCHPNHTGKDEGWVNEGMVDERFKMEDVMYPLHLHHACWPCRGVNPWVGPLWDLQIHPFTWQGLSPPYSPLSKSKESAFN